MQSQWANSSHAADDLERLKLRVRRSPSVPVPKEAALRLLEILKNPDAPTPELERIIGSDPALAASVLAASEADHHGLSTKQFTLRDAIVRLGTRAIKGIALGTSFRIDAGPPVQGFDRKRFARHSLAVAFVSKYIFAKRFLSGGFETNLSADEVYAVGLLHDMGYVLLATVAPEVYGRISFMARRGHTTIQDGFARLFDRDISILAPEFLSRWTHIQDLERALLALKEPWTYEEEYDALCCVNAADCIVTTQCGLATEEWPIDPNFIPEIAELAAIPHEEIQLLTTAVNQHCTRSLLI